MLRKIIAPFLASALLAALFGTTLAGCNTMEGVGKDVQAGGREREKIAMKLGVSLRTERDSRCVDEDGIATTCTAIRVTHQSAHDLGVIRRRSDGVSVREHQPSYPEAYFPGREIHTSVPAGCDPRRAGSVDGSRT